VGSKRQRHTWIFPRASWTVRSEIQRSSLEVTWQEHSHTHIGMDQTKSSIKATFNKKTSQTHNTSLSNTRTLKGRERSFVLSLEKSRRKRRRRRWLEVSGTVAGEPPQWRHRAGNFQHIFLNFFFVQSLLLLLLSPFSKLFLKRGWEIQARSTIIISKKKLRTTWDTFTSSLDLVSQVLEAGSIRWNRSDSGSLVWFQFDSFTMCNDLLSW